MRSKEAGDAAALRGMLDRLPDHIARYRHRDLMVSYCNAAAAAALGREPHEVIGRSLEDHLSPADHLDLREHLDRLGPDTPTLTKTVRWVREDGQVTWLEWIDQWSPSDDGGEVLAIGHDVTERVLTEQRLRESEQRFRIAMNDAPIGMALVGLDARFLAVNRVLCEFLGRPEDELLGMTTLDVTHPDDVLADLDYGRSSQRGEDHERLVKRYLRPDGSVVWGLLKVSTVHDDEGEPSYIIGQVVDVTDQIAYEERLREAAATERAAAEKLRNIDMAKSAFLSAVSHELRTPLTIVQGTAATLRRHGTTLDEQTRLDLHLALEQQTVRLSRLLDELLDLDRLVHGARTVLATRFDVSPVLDEQVASAGLAHRVRLQAPPEHWLVADRVQVERIVANLLGNAVKYAPEGPVDVRLAPLPSASGEDDGGIRLEIRDRGPGIPEADRDRVFEPFHRSSGDHPQPGTGIGLSLVRGFARLHGGDAWVQPSEIGAHMVVEVPSVEANP